ncbi:hypothetical protein B0H13DRAFT_2313352 [Mycena leptocephala]|nr:hypothetical protein B0H13DRAFT_2313352 [Mycena leptocephala]
MSLGLRTYAARHLLRFCPANPGLAPDLSRALPAPPHRTGHDPGEKAAMDTPQADTTEDLNLSNDADDAPALLCTRTSKDAIASRIFREASPELDRTFDLTVRATNAPPTRPLGLAVPAAPAHGSPSRVVPKEEEVKDRERTS